MNKPFNAVSVSRARANRLRLWWQQRMGWPGTGELSASFVQALREGKIGSP